MEWNTGMVEWHFNTLVLFRPEYYKAKYTESILIDKHCVGNFDNKDAKSPLG